MGLFFLIWSPFNSYDMSAWLVFASVTSHLSWLRITTQPKAICFKIFENIYIRLWKWGTTELWRRSSHVVFMHEFIHRLLKIFISQLQYMKVFLPEQFMLQVLSMYYTTLNCFISQVLWFLGVYSGVCYAIKVVTKFFEALGQVEVSQRYLKNDQKINLRI